MTSRIIVAVNAIFVVSRGGGGDSLQETMKHRIQQVLAHLHIPKNICSGTSGSKAALLQCVIGEDIEEDSTVHCHLKLECSSREQALYAVDKIQPLFFQQSDTGTPALSQSRHSTPPLSSEPPLEWNVWMVAPTTADRPPNPKVIPPGTSTPLFCMNANLHIQPDHREELLTLLEHARSESIKEPLCIEYQYGESLTTPNTFHVHQEYSGDNGGKEGYDTHKTTPHYQTWKEFANDEERFSKKPKGYTFRRKMSSMSEQSPHDKNNDCILLDGGTGHELKQRGVITDGSFLAGLLANERQPDIVQSVHWDFVHHGGCRVLTTNSFVAVPERVQQDILMTTEDDASSPSVSQDVVQRTRELIVAAVKCARTVANKHDGVQVAGTVPPLNECYQPSLVPTDPNDLVPIYRLLLSTLIQAGVDILLAETLSTSREAIAIVRALSELKQEESNANTMMPPLWISLTIDDFQQPTTLRSDEPLDAALDSILKEATNRNIHVSAVGVNCASPSAVTQAIPFISAATKKTDQRPLPRVMAYANAFRTTTSEWLTSEGKHDIQNLYGASASASSTESQNDEYDSEGVLLPEAYGRYAKKWQTLGASIIGGCCGCSPIHLKAAADELGVNSS